ncbi:MAG: hypothetical protein AB1847_16745 [bacterium]
MKENTGQQQQKQEIINDIARIEDAIQELISLRNLRIRDLARLLHHDVNLAPVTIEPVTIAGVNPLAMPN